MDEIRVRADVDGFARDVAAMRAELTPLVQGAEAAGRVIETSLLRAIRNGRFGFEDLKRTALSALADIAAAAVKGGLAQILGGIVGGGGVGGALGGLLGLPGRATGGPVSPGRAYLVGERGPELFVPTTSGSVATGHGGGPREVRVAITVKGPGDAAPGLLARSGRQVARAVRRALEDD